MDYFASKITRAQTIAVIVLYFSSPVEPEPSPMVMQSLTPGEGLMLEHPSGAMIEIPADATAGPEGEELMVSVEEVAVPEENVLPVGKVFGFSVVDQDGDDVHLREPVEITVPYTLPEGKDAADVALLHWDERLGRWEAVESGVVDQAGGTVTAQVEDLSDFAIYWYLNPIEFIAVSAFALVGATALQADYDLGYKHLVSFHVDYGFRPPVFPAAKIGKVGGSLVFDLDDLASLPLVQDTVDDLIDIEPITVEGGDNFVTFWLNMHAAASFELDPLAGVGSDVGGFGIGISLSNPHTGRYSGTEYNRDPRFDASLTAATVTLPGGVGDFSFLTVNANGNVHPAEAQLNKCITCGLELKIGIEVAGVTLNLVKGELNTNVLNEAFADLLDPDQPDSCSVEEEGNTLPGRPGQGGGEVSQEFMASELICTIFSNVGDSIQTLVTESIYGFTEFEHLSPRQVANLDASQFNQIAGFEGGHDVNDDGRGELVFPSHDGTGSPLGNLPLRVLTTGDREETRDYYLELRTVPAGWEITMNDVLSVWREDLSPVFNRDPFLSDALERLEFRTPALSVNETHWLVTATPQAGDHGVATFWLLHDKPGPGDEVVGKLFLDLWQDKVLADLSVEAAASLDPVAAGETLFYSVRVANDGPDRAEGVRLHALHTLGDGLVFQGATVSGRSISCSGSSQFQGPVCGLGPLDGGESVELTLEFDLMARLTESEMVSVQFAVESVPGGGSQGAMPPREDPVPGNNTAAVSRGVRTPDRDALEAIYNATGGAGWNQQRHWLSGEPLEDWYGVSTDRFGRVTALDLYYVGLRGPLPAEIGGLTYLEELSIAQNVGLSGRLPPELGRLTNLRRIYITGSRLQGEIPAELAMLTGLQDLSLHNNNLEGPIPSWLADLTGLQRLYLAGNAFTGCVPEGLADVPDNDLASLGLEDCGGGAGEFASVSAGWQHNCGVRRDGSVACWGHNGDGRAAPPAGEFASVSAGSVHTCGVRRDGSVACWGWNRYGQATPPAGEFASVSAGNLHTCGVRRDGSVACWGDDSQSRVTPPAGEFASVSAGGGHTCGVKRDGTVACWGWNGQGQATPPAGEFASVSAGGNHTCGVRRDGSVACWGYNRDGQATPPAGEFASVSAGGGHTCGVKRDGTVACWGIHAHGRATPPAGEFASVSAGGAHTCGVKRDGSVACWGDNTYGQATPPGTHGPAFTHNPAMDFNTLVAAGNTAPEDFWPQGTTVWVSDAVDGKIYAYNLKYETKQRDSSQDFNTLAAAGNHRPHGIWSDGTTMWVAQNQNSRASKIYAYNLDTKQRDGSKDFDTLAAAGNHRPDGIWSDAATMWVADWSDGKLYGVRPPASLPDRFSASGKCTSHLGFGLDTKQRDGSKDFDTLAAAGNHRPDGIWSDAATMWVATGATASYTPTAWRPSRGTAPRTSIP